MEDLEYFDAVLPILLHGVEIWGFYVKSLLADFRRSKAAISTIFRGCKFKFFGKISYLKMSKIAKTSKFWVAFIDQNNNFWDPKIAKFDFT